jgi:CRP-like cAMP-binding protein
MRPHRSLRDAANVDELMARLARLSPATPRQWGTMTPNEMLCHLADSFHSVLGDRPTSTVDTLLSRTVVKWIALRSQHRRRSHSAIRLARREAWPASGTITCGSSASDQSRDNSMTRQNRTGTVRHYPPMKPDIKRRSANHLLNSLEPAAFERLVKKLKRVKLRPKEVVYKPNEPIEHVLFPENAVLCLMTVMSNGDTIEAATVGREGASWISASVGAPSMPCETIVVIEGTALNLPIADLDRELKENGHFRDVLTEYSHALLIASMRTSACNGLHGLQERCARWILTTLDRVDSDGFTVTKEFLAQLLGTNRPTVSVLVSVLEKAGMLNVKGRWVTVADRNRLKEAACECYDIIRKNYEAVGR